MKYIFLNWSELNLIDRAWFLAGIWLILLFFGVFISRVIRYFRKNAFKRSPTSSNNIEQEIH